MCACMRMAAFLTPALRQHPLSKAWARCFVVSVHATRLLGRAQDPLLSDAPCLGQLQCRVLTGDGLRNTRNTVAVTFQAFHAEAGRLNS